MNTTDSRFGIEPSKTELNSPLSSQSRRWMRLEGTPLTFDRSLEAQKSEQALLSTEAGNGRFQRSLYELFSEMEEKDGQLYSLLQTRINALLGLEMVWESGASGSGTTNAKADRVRAFLAETLSQFPRFKEFLRALLEALPKGFAVVELIWGYNADGRWVVQDWRAHPQEYFAFQPEPSGASCSGLLLQSPPFANNTAETQRDTVLHGTQKPIERLGSLGKAFAAPERKFVLLQFGCDARNPFGRGLCQRAYWYYWFKKNTLRSWALYNEKYA